MEDLQRIFDEPPHSSVDDVASTAPAVNTFRRMPSGNSFAQMPCVLERTGSGLDRSGSGNLTRVPSGLAELSFTLSQLHESNKASADTTPAPPSTLRMADATQEIEACAAGWVYDMATLDRCSSGEHVAANVASLPETTSSVVGTSAAMLGPWGPYNPPPSWAQEHVAASETREPDEFEGKQVVMVRGKYKGRSAFVQRKVNKKYRLQVEGVTWGLEFFPNMFELPRAGPMLARC